MNKKYLLALAASTLMFAACGDDVTEVNEIHQDGMAVLEAGEKLSKQACDTTNVGEMLFVMDSSAAFVCDGKSWQTLKGEDGENGTSCTVKKSDGKSVITCTDAKGKVVSTAEVKDGENGEDGLSCSVEKKGGKSVISCTDAKGNVVTSAEVKDGENGEPCLVSDNNDGTMTITCGEDETTLYKAVCGTKPYDPAKSFCSEGELYSCNGKPYDPKKQYCLEVTRDGSDIYSVEALLTDARDEEHVQVYKTVEICNNETSTCQTWMAENLNYSVNPGTQSWCGGGSGATEGDCSVYGRLYTWAAAVGKSEDECGDGKTCNLPSGDIRGVCPEGWHLPSKDEWETLFTAVGGSSKAGTALKSQTGWYSQTGDVADRDANGFSALPAGYRLSDGYFRNAGNFAFFWSASENGSYYAYHMNLYYDDEGAYLGDLNKYYGYSVRCLQNN